MGTASKAMEYIERARGHLIAFHQLTGSAHLAWEQAAEEFEAAGEHASAEFVHAQVVGLNVLEGRWTFQVVEEYDAGYYADMLAATAKLRDEHMAGRTHVYEAEMKARLTRPADPRQRPTPGA